MSLTASVEGVDRLVATLDDAARQLVELAPPEAGADALAATAIPLTPVYQGDLVRTVKATVIDQDIVLQAGGGPVYYAALVNARRPWLAEAITREADHITDLVVDQVDQIITTIEGA